MPTEKLSGKMNIIERTVYISNLTRNRKAPQPLCLSSRKKGEEFIMVKISDEGKKRGIVALRCCLLRMVLV